MMTWMTLERSSSAVIEEDVGGDPIRSPEVTKEDNQTPVVTKVRNLTSVEALEVDFISITQPPDSLAVNVEKSYGLLGLGSQDKSILLNNNEIFWFARN